MSVAQKIAEALGGARKAGKEWKCLCPLHTDEHPSLDITDRKGGQVLVICRAGCDGDALVGELKRRGLWPSLPAKPKKIEEAIYKYFDAQGVYQYEKVRFRLETGEKEFWFRRPKPGGGFVYKLGDTSKVLYNLPAVLETAAAGGYVWVVAGEKCADELIGRGMCATTNPEGELQPGDKRHKWKPEYTKCLKGAQVIVLADNDDVGRHHSHTVARLLYEQSIKSKVVEFSELPEKGDVYDYFHFLGKTNEELADRVRAVTAWKPVSVVSADGVQGHTHRITTEGFEPLWDTDMSNAIRFKQEHGAIVKHVPELGFLVWGESRWVKDKKNKLAMQLAKGVVRKLQQETEGLEWKQKWVRRSQMASQLKAMLTLVESEPGVTVGLDDLDANPFLLNVSNGTVDLQTGERLDHNKSHLITKVVPIDYNPDAKCPRWEQFMRECMADNEDMITFLQRAGGCTLTASNRDEKLFFVHGIGANGKSTWLEMLMTVCGEYGVSATKQTFMKQQNESQAHSLSKLMGSRYVMVDEVSETDRFDEERIKKFSSGHTMSARLLYQEPLDFKPTGKVWLSGNYKPRINPSDYAVWRRVLLIPFSVTIPEGDRDPNLLETLKRERQGILSWFVRGCMEWQRMGLVPPDEVDKATEEYRMENDIIGEFLKETCYEDKTAWVDAGDIYAAYRFWCDQSGHTPMNGHRFGRDLTRRRVIKEHYRRGWKYVGIGIKAEFHGYENKYEDNKKRYGSDD